MAKNPNAPGGGNRQGPGTSKQGKRGPITGKMTSVTGSTQPFDMSKGKASGAGRNASGHSWKKRPPH